MEPPGPARLYATAAGALLVILGVVGFFYGSSFGSPGTVDHTLGVLRTNGWGNLLWIALGALGLLTAGSFSRPYAFVSGTLFTVLGIWGLTVPAGATILSVLPAANEAFYLVLGILGVLAAVGTPSQAGEPGRAASERTSPQFVREGAARPGPRSS